MNDLKNPMIGRAVLSPKSSVEQHWAAVKNAGHPLADAYLAAETKVVQPGNESRPKEVAA